MRRRVVILAVALGATLVICGMVVAFVGHIRELDRRLACAANMKAIAAFLRIYAADDEMIQGNVLEQLVTSGHLPRTTLTCPTSGRSNYIYVPLPSAEPIDNRTVVMYEPKSNHGDGGSFLFADGHVMFHSGEMYDRLASDPQGWWKE